MKIGKYHLLISKCVKGFHFISSWAKASNIVCDFVGRIECVEILVKSGSEIDCKDKKVQPLYFVCVN